MLNGQGSPEEVQCILGVDGAEASPETSLTLTLMGNRSTLKTSWKEATSLDSSHQRRWGRSNITRTYVSLRHEP